MDLFEWNSPYHTHDYYDLTIDALEIMEDYDHIADLAFSKVRYWEASIL